MLLSSYQNRPDGEGDAQVLIDSSLPCPISSTLLQWPRLSPPEMCNRDEGGKPGPVREKAGRKQVPSVSLLSDSKRGPGPWTSVRMWHKVEERGWAAGGPHKGWEEGGGPWRRLPLQQLWPLKVRQSQQYNGAAGRAWGRDQPEEGKTGQRIRMEGKAWVSVTGIYLFIWLHQVFPAACGL